jgi:hypothetical protein
MKLASKAPSHFGATGGNSRFLRSVTPSTPNATKSFATT